MSDNSTPGFTASESEALADLTAGLISEGWADFVTIERLLSEWITLAQAGDRYQFSVDDYANDLTSRDGLELVLRRCQPPLKAKLLSYIELADQEFARRTKSDDQEVLAQFFRIDARDGWWWKRIPSDGPLAHYLEEDHRA